MLDLHFMSVSAAQAMVQAWLLLLRSLIMEGHQLPDSLRYDYYYF